jgi:two-component system, cell cycle sensor histidine kinase and response regulator CckA
MSRDRAYDKETRIKTRNLGLVMSLILVPMVCVFMYIDHTSSFLGGILGWRIGALLPALLFLTYSLFAFRPLPRLAVPLHVLQLSGLMVMMCGIAAEVATRPALPPFARSGLISSLLVCIFADFVFAGGARKYLFAILIPPLAGMSITVMTVGAFLTQTEQVWLISNPSAMAVVLSILALYQERANARDFRTRSELGRAEKAVRESEKKFRDLFDNSEVGMIRSRLDGSEIIDVNQSFLNLAGRTREELASSPSAMYWAVPHEREEMMAILARDGHVANYECSLVNARGEERSCLASLRLFHEQGVLEGSLVDITERKRAGEWLDVLRHSIDAAADGAYWLKEDGSFFYANESGCRSLGYSLAELMGLRVEDVNPQATLEAWAEVWKILREKKSLDAESIHRRKDGSLFPVQITTSFIRSGGQNYAVGFAHDITERRRLEAEREAVLQRLEFVIATTRTGLDIIDENYIVRYVDPARRKLMGDPTGRTCYEYFRGRSSRCGDCAMQKALETRKVQVREQTLPGENNRPTQVTALPYQDESGTWLVAEVIVDITERKQAEAERLNLERQIASSQKLEGLGILAGGVAHNFNNLLTVILGHAELLREALPRPASGAESVLEIIKAGNRSRDLIRQLLTLGRRQVLELKPLDLNVVIRECSAMLRQALRENIAIEYRLLPAPCPVAADPGKIEEILLNLALNAQDAIPREGQLEIATTEVILEGAFVRRHDDIAPGRYILLSVSDTGQGIDGETVTKIFDPFFTTKEQGKGTGLGLSTVYGIIKQHSGSIEVESRPGAGTRFQIYLPRTQIPAGEAHASEIENPVGGAETVLLVEDEAPIRTMLSRHLRSLGYTVLEAADGVSALQMFAEHGRAVHILVTDVVMPRMNGTELQDRLRSKVPALRVLFMSGYPREVIRSHVARDEEMDLIMKPFTGQALATRVREALDRSQDA